MDPPRDWRALTVHYSDEMEYDVGHCGYNNEEPGRPGGEGRLLADLDNTYDRESVAACHPLRIGGTGSGSVAGQSAARQRSGTREDLSKQQSRQAPLQANHYDNTLSWPASIDQFRVGDRVDALDHKGSWFSGSVVDVFRVTEADIQQCGLSKYSRDAIAAKEPSAARARSGSGGGTPTAKQRLLPGVHVRIHFDNFSFIWDEWFDQRDYERGKDLCFKLNIHVYSNGALCVIRRLHLPRVQQGAAQAQDFRPPGGAAAPRAPGQPHRVLLAHSGRCGRRQHLEQCGSPRGRRGEWGVRAGSAY